MPTPTDPIEAAKPHISVRVGTGLALLGGLLTALVGFQIMGVEFVAGWMNLAQFVFPAVGVGLALSALAALRGRRTAAFAFPLMSGLALAATCGWMLVTFGAILSPLLILAILANSATTVIAAFAWQRVLIQATAIEALKRDGLSLGK